MSIRFVLLCSLLSLMLSVPAKAAEAPVRVVVSIAPIHSLATAVMEGVAEPSLLVKGGASPHSVMMKPSQMRLLQAADLVIWVGENLESFLPRVLSSLPKSVSVLELMDLNTLTLLPARQGGSWQGHGHDEHAAQGRHGHADYDGHIWLDPRNAMAIVEVLAVHLVKIDPRNADRYRDNAKRLLARLSELDERLSREIEPLARQPFVVFHDAYHYLENRYGLNAVGAVSVDPERKPSAKRLREIRNMLEHQGVVCMFSQPQFSRTVIDAVAEGMAVKTAELDPMGLGLSSGVDMYFVLMDRLSRNLVACLK